MSETIEHTKRISRRKAFRKGEIHGPDFAFYLLVRTIGVLVVLGFLWIFISLYQNSAPLIAARGWGCLFHLDWDPERGNFGILSFIYGTIASSLIALLISVPIALASGLFLSEIAKGKIRSATAFLLEMLAAIPSVVFGLWGIFVVVPIVRNQIQPALSSFFFFLPQFQGPKFGVGIFTAGLILSIMILPTIISVCREVFQAIPNTIREAALGLGATKWEMIKISVLRSSTSGILGAVVLGLARALGETMAVAMLIGNRAEISKSIFAPGATMASVIANEYAEASGGLHIAALSAVGMGLLAISLIINLLAGMIVARARRFN